MGEAKKHRDAIQRVNDRSNREDAMHKRAQRAEGDLLKARAEIERLEGVFLSAEATIENLCAAEDGIRRAAHNAAIDTAIARLRGCGYVDGDAEMIEILALKK